MTTPIPDPQTTPILSEEIQRIAALEEQIEFLQQEKETFIVQQKEQEEKYLRAVADLQNVRRRADEDRIKARLDGNIDMLTGILTLVDHFSLAFAHLPQDLKEHEWIKGMMAVEKNFYDHLKNSGVEFIAEEGVNFDASLHESVMLDAAGEPGKVGKILERGVKFKGRVIRPAKVSVGAEKQ
ncbi:MAG: nucleotide exchange factor GrpE [Candidatus Peregrinibacteria bacterium]